MPQFQHLLVPVDFTGKNDVALATARDLAAGNETRITLMHVIERIDDDVDPELTEFYDRLNTRAADNMQPLATRLSDAGIHVATDIRLGRRVPEIVQFANDHAVDLIVLSSHRIDREHPARSLATISYQVSILCNCAVMLVK